MPAMPRRPAASPRNSSPASMFCRRCWRRPVYNADRHGNRMTSASSSAAAPSARLTILGIETSWDGLAHALFLAATLLVVATFTDYGITWDEDVQDRKSTRLNSSH